MGKKSKNIKKINERNETIVHETSDGDRELEQPGPFMETDICADSPIFIEESGLDYEEI